ncbi:MAG TPA: NYN domain-containing protein [Gemmata sp.]
MKTAFFIDGAFYLKRLRSLKRANQTGKEAVDALVGLVAAHLTQLNRNDFHLFRILVYDCPPLSKKTNLPITHTAHDFAKMETFVFRSAFHEHLRLARKVALRLGRLNAQYGEWKLKPEALKELRNKKRLFADVTDNDFDFDVGQKGADMRLGLDIASIAIRRLVDQMVLVAGDSDFVPAAKTARREDIDFILDPMGAPVPADLRENVDGVQSVIEQVPAPPPPPL